MNISNKTETSQAYARHKKIFFRTRNNFDYWKKEFQIFKKYLEQGSVVDIGCGFGRDARLFIQNGYKYVGIDNSMEMIKLAKKNAPEATFKLMDFTKISFLSKSFNGFWSVLSLIHLQKKEISQFLIRLKKILKPSFVGLIIMKQGDGEGFENWHSSKRFIARYTIREFSRVLKNCNFNVLKVLKRKHDFLKKEYYLCFFVCEKQ